MPEPPTSNPEWNIAEKWASEGHGVALATVVSTWGSAPRPMGSLLVIREDGLFEGSVSGGCIEGAVVVEGQDILKSKKPKLMDFGVSNTKAWEVGLACGGKISVLIEPLTTDKLKIIKTLNKKRNAGQNAVLATDVRSGETRLFPAPKADQSGWQKFEEKAKKALEQEKPQLVEAGGKKIFLNVFHRPYRMFLIGAVHIAQSLVPLALQAGYEVTVIDPRGAFADAERFPAALVVEDWPDDVLQKKSPDSSSAVITLTHDPKLDDAALGVALKSDAFYIGSLGSRKTHGARLERLKKAGFSDQTLRRIKGPVGLAIGAKTPFEIALSILADVTLHRRKKAEPR